MLSDRKDTLLLVGGADSGRTDLRATFSDTYRLLEAESAAQAALLLGQHSPSIAAVLADFPLKNGDELRALTAASHLGTEDEIPILLFFSPDETDTQEEYALLLGAADVIRKPYSTLRVQRRVQMLVDLFHYKRSLGEQTKAAAPADDASFQFSQSKLQALLRHTNDTVVEMDLDRHTCQVIYNTDPDLEELLDHISLQDLLEHLALNGAHPDGVSCGVDLQCQCTDALFQQHALRYSFPYRISGLAKGKKSSYQVTMLRLSPDGDQHRLLVVFHPGAPALAEGDRPERDKLPPSHSLDTLTCCVLRCRMDEALTIDLGVTNLLPLTGYSDEEVERLFGGSLRELIAPEHRFALSAFVRRCAKSGVREEAEFRLRRRDASPVWTLIKACVHTELDDQQSLYLTFTDITFLKKRQAQLEATVRRDEIILNQAECVIFDWDLSQDKLICSDRWFQRFGYEPISDHFSTRLDYASHFHPDDLPLIREASQAIHQGKPFIDLNARLANDSGQYLWSRIRATTIFNERGEPSRLIGFITDINELKSAVLSMKEKAEQDGLTKLLNKDSCQRLVTLALAERTPDERSCLLILDLDNFKTVNDSYGHLYGDALLIQVSTTLRKLFRAQDIVARIGGDEFLVFLKGIPDVDTLRNKCELMMNAFRDLFGRLMPNLNVSCSMGCALAPEHGTTYSQLFQHADKALYNVKNLGKNCYHIYDPMEQYQVLNGMACTTRVDSDEQLSDSDDAFVRFVFHRLYESRDLNATIDELLAFIGTRFQVSRMYIFENSPDNTCCFNTFEWCNTDIPSAKEALQCLSYETDIPGWPDFFDDDGIFYCTDITKLPPHFRNLLEPHGIRSMLCCSMMDGDVFRGFVGFDEYTSNRLWTRDQISALDLLSEVLAVFLVRQHPRYLPLTPHSTP
jgi:putative two-component system response regulator